MSRILKLATVSANFLEKNAVLEFWHITRLILSGCISGRSRHRHRLRRKILHRSIKKIIKKKMKTKKLEQLEIGI